MTSALPEPVLGLALGGGIARGWAHIGVVKALVEAGIKPGVVCGTSMGALVGGCLLAGRLDTLEAWALGLSRRRILGYMDFAIRRPGLIGGERLGRLLDQHLGELRIEDLPAPFAAITADLFTGHEVWLREGRLSHALRASFALPGVFPPVRVGHHTLIDGALVNPIPVSACRALGADVVVAVNLNSEMLGKTRAPGGGYARVAGFDLLEEASNSPGLFSAGLNGLVRRVFRRDPAEPSLFGVMISALNIILDRISRSRLAGEPPDVQIAPRLGHIGLVEFDRAAELIALGAEATKTAVPDIQDALRIAGGNGAARTPVSGAA